MSISTSENEFRQAARDFLSVVDRAEENAKRAASKSTGSVAPQSKPNVLDRGQILNVELQDAIAAGDKQNAALIRAEMKRMGVKETMTAKELPKKAGKLTPAEQQELDQLRKRFAR